MSSRQELLGVDYNKAFLAADVALVGLGLYVYRMRRTIKDLRGTNVVLQGENAHLREEIKLEPKTRLLNYPAFYEDVSRRTARRADRSERTGDAAKIHGLAFADIDDFKRWNSILTHPVADTEALLPVSRAILSTMRPGRDLACRSSDAGEEFYFFLEDIGEAGMMGLDAFCHRIQYTVNDIHPAGSPNPIGLTMAYTTFRQGEDIAPLFGDLSALALEAKEVSGKNQIVPFERDLQTVS